MPSKRAVVWFDKERGCGHCWRGRGPVRSGAHPVAIILRDSPATHLSTNQRHKVNTRTAQRARNMNMHDKFSRFLMFFNCFVKVACG